MITENTIMMAAKLYEARKSMRMLWGDEYQTKIERYMDALHDCEKYSYKGIIPTAIELADRADKSGLSAVHMVMFLAAAVELLEPDEYSPRGE